jgi:hypothetical protein
VSLLTETRLLGVSCDVKGCDVEQRVDPIPSYGPAADRFLGFLLCDGWARRNGRSVTWFCPKHADRASHCIKGKWGQCSPWCPVHRDGRVATWASEDARRLQGLDNMLTRMDRAR